MKGINLHLINYCCIPTRCMLLTQQSWGIYFWMNFIGALCGSSCLSKYDKNNMEVVLLAKNEMKNCWIYFQVSGVSTGNGWKQTPYKTIMPLQILEWKWETISIDFIIVFPRIVRKHDAIMVVVNKLSKVAHFIPIKSTFKSLDVVDVFMKEIFRLHGLPKTIISYRDAKFNSIFCKILFIGLGTQLEFITTYHPQKNGQTERVNIILEDMLRMHVMHQPK